MGAGDVHYPWLTADFQPDSQTWSRYSATRPAPNNIKEQKIHGPYESCFIRKAVLLSD